MSRTILRTGLLAIIVGIGAGAPAVAQLSQQQPIRIVVSLAPGGATDVGTRIMANAYAEQTGQHVIVENRPGGGGAIALMGVKSAAADGHTLVVIDNGACCANIFLSDVGYDTTKDFKPVLLLWSFPNLLLVGANSPAKSVADVVALARSRPGGLTFGSSGVATSGHILGAMLAKAANIPLVHVPFRGALPAVTELAAGRIDLLFASYASVGAFIEDGRVRPLASGAEKTDGGAVPGYPSLPTMAELGYPGVRLEVWFMLLAPGGTPDAVVEQLHAGFAKALRSESVRQKLASLQMHVPTTGTPADVMKRMREEIDMVGPIMKGIASKAN